MSTFIDFASEIVGSEIILIERNKLIERCIEAL